MFKGEEIHYFRNLKLSDIIHETTYIDDTDIQKNVFFWLQGDPCPQMTQLNASKLEPCPFLKGYDYFQVCSIKIMNFAC
jgi:dual oxidase